MTLTWKDIFKYIEQMWGLNATQIAGYLERDRSTITRILSGERKRFKYELVVLYKVLFDTTNEKCPVHKTNKTGLLRELIEYFEKEHKEEINGLIKDIEINDDGYEPFVMGLLRLAKKNEPPLPKSQSPNNNKNAPLSKNESEVISQNEDQSKKLSDIFIEVCVKCKIMDIINRKPAVFNWDDSARLNYYVKRTLDLIGGPAKEKCGNTTVYADIKMFIDALHIQAITIMGNLNRRFDFEDDSASINMEEDDSTELNVKPNKIELLRLSIEGISKTDAVYESEYNEYSDEDDDDDDVFDEDDDGKEEVFDALVLADIATREWGDFRNEMNFLYKKISETIF